MSEATVSDSTSRGQVLAERAAANRGVLPGGGTLNACYAVLWDSPDDDPPPDGDPITFRTREGELTLTFGEFRAAALGALQNDEALGDQIATILADFNVECGHGGPGVYYELLQALCTAAAEAVCAAASAESPGGLDLGEHGQFHPVMGHLFPFDGGPCVLCSIGGANGR